MADRTKPMTKPEVLELLCICRSQVEALLPLDDVRRKYVLPELARIEDLVNDHFPLTATERNSIHLGLYAARELETFNDKLADDLETLDFQLVDI